MTPARLTFALVLSLILVAGASWIRLSRASSVSVNNIAAANPALTPAEYEAAVAQVVADLSTTTAPTTAPQTDTSIVSENLFTDYFGLVSNGQATPDNIDALTQSYADTVSNLSTSGRIQPSDLNLVSDSTAHFSTYLTNLNEVYDKYLGLLTDQSEPDATHLDAKFAKWASSVAKLYAREVTELEAIPVPASLIEDHTKLINNYISNEAALENIANAATDPARAMGGIAVMNQNSTDEKDILTDIQKIAEKNGIISSNP